MSKTSLTWAKRVPEVHFQVKFDIGLLKVSHYLSEHYNLGMTVSVRDCSA